MSAPPLETARLLLRALSRGDAPAVQQLADDWRIADTTARIPQPYLLHHAIAWIDSLRPAEAAGRHTWGITLRDTGELIGSVHLIVTRRDPFGDAGTLGYWIGVPYWNRGYATEASQAVLRLGFDELGLERVDAVHLTRNIASGRVLAKLGMRHVGSSVDVVRGELEPIERYCVTREEYSAGGRRR